MPRAKPGVLGVGGVEKASKEQIIKNQGILEKIWKKMMFFFIGTALEV